MRALRLHGPGLLSLEEIPAPSDPVRGEVAVDLLAAGICGSDLHTYIDGRIGDTVVRDPLVPGHEFSAVVTATGPEAISGAGEDLRPGQRVAVEPAIACGNCPPCRRNDPHLCDRIRFLGHSPVDGCLRERLVVPAHNCFVLPSSIGDAAGALLEPLGVALHAVRLAGFGPGMRVAVIGAGPIGAMIVRLAALAGAGRVFASERLPWRRELPTRWGATVFDENDAVPGILEATGGEGVDVTIEAAWGGKALHDAAEMTRPGGTLVLVGIPGDDLLTLKHSAGRRKELTLRFSRRMKHTYPEAIQLVAEGRIAVDELVSHTLPLAAGPEAFRMNAAYEQEVRKVILVPDPAGT